MDSFYAPGRVRRWEPASELPELPLSAFDMSWTADRILICRGYYDADGGSGPEGLILEFRKVHAFASFDGFSDTLLSWNKHLLPLEVPVRYGGCWPFVEVQGSNWVNDVAGENGGLHDDHGYTHWAVIAYDQTLHIMAPSEPTPSFAGWITASS